MFTKIRCVQSAFSMSLFCILLSSVKVSFSYHTCVCVHWDRCCGIV